MKHRRPILPLFLLVALSLPGYFCSPQASKEKPAAAAENVAAQTNIAINEQRWVNSPEGLRMRDAPELAANKIGLLPYAAQVKFIQESGEQLTIDEGTGRWTQVEYEGKTGWVFGGFLTETEPPGFLRISFEKGMRNYQNLENFTDKIDYYKIPTSALGARKGGNWGTIIADKTYLLENPADFRIVQPLFPGEKMEILKISDQYYRLKVGESDDGPVYDYYLFLEVHLSNGTAGYVNSRDCVFDYQESAGYAFATQLMLDVKAHDSEEGIWFSSIEKTMLLIKDRRGREYAHQIGGLAVDEPENIFNFEFVYHTNISVEDLNHDKVDEIIIRGDVTGGSWGSGFGFTGTAEIWCNLVGSECRQIFEYNPSFDVGAEVIKTVTSESVALENNNNDGFDETLIHTLLLTHEMYEPTETETYEILTITYVWDGDYQKYMETKRESREVKGFG